MGRLAALTKRAVDAWDVFTGASPLSYDVSGGGKRLRNWRPSLATAPQAMQLTGVGLARCRDLARNNPWARRGIEATVAAAVGANGLRLLPEFNDSARKKRTQTEFTRWSDQCDYEGLRDLPGFTADVLRTVMVDGSALVLFRTEPGRVPLQLQLLSVDSLDRSRTSDRVVDGVEFDAAGQRVAYWLYRTPGDTFNSSTRIPADWVSHVFMPPAPGCQTGTSWLAPAAVALRELQSYTESELTRAQTAASFAGWIQPADSSPTFLDTEEGTTWQPGTIARLRPGEILQFNDPPESPSYEPFVRCQLRAIAVALGIPYETLSGDIGQTTYASGRLARIDWRARLEVVQHSLLSYQFMRPVWDRWLRYALMAGVLEGTADDYRPVRFSAPTLSMLNAREEVAALLSSVRAGFVSRSEVIESVYGLDPETVENEVGRDNSRADALGLIFDSDARRTSMQGQAQQQTEGDGNAG